MSTNKKYLPGKYLITRILNILLLSLLIDTAFGQIDSNIVFKASRGSWGIPIDDINEIVTFTEVSKSIHGCPTPNISFVSKKPGIVRCVFDGKVIMIRNIQGTKIMIIKYGNYFITYSGLKDVFVTKDDFVNTGQNIGTILGNDDNLFELEIYVTSRENITVDPEPWFRSYLNNYQRKKF